MAAEQVPSYAAIRTEPTQTVAAVSEPVTVALPISNAQTATRIYDLRKVCISVLLWAGVTGGLVIYC